MCPPLTTPDPTTPDLPPELGVRLTPEGAQFCVYAGHATSVEVCLFETGPDGRETERRLPLRHRAHGTWFDTVPGVGLGQRYGYRVDGPWTPYRAERHNPAKLLLDPYARAVEGGVTLHPALYGHHVGADLTGDVTIRDDRDSAAYVPRGVIVDDAFDWGDDRPPRRSLTQSLIYEVHVKNATALHPGVPEELRGTYAGLAHPAFVEHLLGLGVTAVKLLPVHTFSHEPDLVVRGLVNHWGYNTLGFFAPHAPYASASDPQAALDEFKGMVKLLHAAGIEVILDVVYNHTAEQSQEGQTLSWRGLDNRAYYRIDDRGHDIDVTGCGNTMDLTHPVVARMVLDSLRYWVQECHVDGFRFDLAVALARGRDDNFDTTHPFLVSLRTDPVLSRVKLIAEPWDVGIHGWRTGQFPPPFSEWNDRYRDTLRTFWLRDVAASTSGIPGHGVRDLATRLAGSQDLFGRRDRGTIASINFVTAHDGFTLADLTAYNVKHNGPNGHGGADGTNDNRSWNHGVEGRTTDPAILAARRRTMRNLLGTLLMSTGVPMLNAGDELGRSQRGNNNAYCQDNETSWFSWDLEPWQVDLLETTQHLARLRRDHPVLRQRPFFTGRPGNPDGTTDLAWFAADGGPMDHRWDAPGTHVLQAFYNGTSIDQQSVLISVNGAAHPAEVRLPVEAGPAAYELLWDSTDEKPAPRGESANAGTAVTMGPASMRVWRAVAGM
ncbi:glycogen debranching protein [Intrasporangium oryzae NRRL B-24470]|uniref:Glycogen debranching protein n=1 Tax=Intrasporangium oryzae NRRL B-24470 TaxID=1386089 RepID=W9GAK6_9MICO|nr:glycogen debranching protein GlgX [Intrasporangium oryzae]EWT02262.1 glycogen debranching protein [Intrasporangium oryzae NRRL B-24470]